MVFLFTVISVSVDAYYAGLAFNIGERMTFSDCIYAAFYTFVFCLLASLVRCIAGEYIELLDISGGIILCCIGIQYIFKTYDNRASRCDRYYMFESGRKNRGKITALGLSVSADAAAATIALPVLSSPVIKAFLMFAAHSFFLILGAVSARPMKGFVGATAVSGVFLLLMGMSRILL